MNLFEPCCPSRECNVERRWRENFQPFHPFSLLLSFFFSSFLLVRRRKTINPGVQLRHEAPLTPDNGSVLVSSRLIAKLFLFSVGRESRPTMAPQAPLRPPLYWNRTIGFDAGAHHSRDWTHAIVCIRALRVRRASVLSSRLLVGQIEDLFVLASVSVVLINP